VAFEVHQVGKLGLDSDSFPVRKSSPPLEARKLDQISFPSSLSPCPTPPLLRPAHLVLILLTLPPEKRHSLLDDRCCSSKWAMSPPSIASHRCTQRPLGGRSSSTCGTPPPTIVDRRALSLSYDLFPLDLDTGQEGKAPDLRRFCRCHHGLQQTIN
jgi:hypothetical protein